MNAELDGTDAKTTPDRDPPLCVDLDGTLLRTDILAESALALLSRNPFYLFAFGWWLLRGRAYLKQAIAQRAELCVADLPYNTELLHWLREQKLQRSLLLCTAADRTSADAVAKHLQLFDAVLASDGASNLLGRRKAQALLKRYGERGFDYVGNERADIAVWRHARHAIVIGGSGLARAVAKVCDVERSFAPASPWRAAIKALRPHQWLKNLLLFVPMLAAHRFFDAGALAAVALAFVSFCLCASGVYLLNDLLDLAADRAHPRKRSRPFASGHLPLSVGLLGAPLLTLAAYVIAAALLPLAFVAWLTVYLIATLAYSLALKRVAMLDVLLLAGLYTVRVIAGGAASTVPLSFWLLAFAMFVFLSLAMLKRYAELHDLRANGGSLVNGRGYDVDDLPLVQSLGAASGYVSVLVLALYIQSSASAALYSRPMLLWLLCPLLLYWISRAWMLAHRGRMHDDPLAFAATDGVSLVVVALAALAVILAL